MSFNRKDSGVTKMYVPFNFALLMHSVHDGSLFLTEPC